MSEHISTALFMVKPEVFEQRDEIKKFVETNSQLNIIASKVITIDETVIDNVYLDDAGSDLLTAIRLHLLGKKAEISLVEKQGEPDAATELLRVCGHHFNPELCEPNTVRRVFGLAELAIYAGIPYYLNAVHRSSAEEAPIVTAWCVQNFFDSRG